MSAISGRRGFIVDALAESDARVLVIYGELHVGRVHCPPYRARSRARSSGAGDVRLGPSEHNTPFMAPGRKGLEHSTDCVRLARDTYCVISGTPWGKLQCSPIGSTAAIIGSATSYRRRLTRTPMATRTMTGSAGVDRLSRSPLRHPDQQGARDCRPDFSDLEIRDLRQADSFAIPNVA